MNLILEPPYDSGFPHVLRRGEERAVVSADTAHVLYACGIPLEHMTSDTGVPLRDVNLDLLRDRKPKLSKKAQRMLEL